MHIQRALEQLGYPHNEIVTYLALLKMGEATVSEIARKTQLPRSTAQLVVTELQKKGLASLCIKRTHPVWLAESPSHFLANIHQNELIIKQILPELQALRHLTDRKALLKYYNGSASIEHIFEEVLASHYPIQILGSVAHMSMYLGKEMVENFISKLFSSPVPVRLLSSSSDFVDEIKKNNHSAQSRVSVYPDERLTRVVYILFNQKVALILLSTQESVGVIFDNSGLYDSSEVFFKRLWEDAVD